MPFRTCWRCNLCCHVALRPCLQLPAVRTACCPFALAALARAQPFIIHIYLDYTIIHLTQTSPPLLFHPRRVHEAILFFRRRRTTAGSSAFFIKRGVGGAAPEIFFLQISLLFLFFSFLFSSFSSLLFLLRLYFAACRRQLIFFPAQPGLCMVSRCRLTLSGAGCFQLDRVNSSLSHHAQPKTNYPARFHSVQVTCILRM